MTAILFQKLPSTYDAAKNGLLNAITLGNSTFPGTRSELAVVIDNYKVISIKDSTTTTIADVRATKQDKEKANDRNELQKAVTVTKDDSSAATSVSSMSSTTQSTGGANG